MPPKCFEFFLFFFFCKVRLILESNHCYEERWPIIQSNPAIDLLLISYVHHQIATNFSKGLMLGTVLGIDRMPLSLFSHRYTTVEKLQQSYLFIPNKYKVRNFFVSTWTWIITVLKFLSYRQKRGVLRENQSCEVFFHMYININSNEIPINFHPKSWYPQAWKCYHHM